MVKKSIDVTLRPEMIEDIDTINEYIFALYTMRKILSGKVVPDTKGLGNKFKYYILGYVRA